MRREVTLGRRAAQQECRSCCQLREDLTRLQNASEERARQDHQQCVAIYQQMKRLAQLNASLTRRCNDSSKSIAVDKAGGGRNGKPGIADGTQQQESLPNSDRKSKEHLAAKDAQLERLQAIIVEQAAELDTLRRKQRDSMADGRVRPAHPPHHMHQLEDGAEKRSAVPQDDINDETDSDEEGDEARIPRKRHARHLQRLPLTSLHAQLKGKDLQVRRLQQLAAKLESRFEQLVERKRSMAQSYQQTARAQQAHLRKYLAHIQQQAVEKGSLERKVRELNQYVAVLEKRVVERARSSS